MLSIGKMVSGAEDYYLKTVADGREEYYTGAGEAPGTWLGSSAAQLGLSGEVAPDDLRMLLAGVAPDGRCLTTGRAKSAGRVAGFDLTFSAPKSVSLLYGLGDDEVSAATRDAHADAVAGALDYLERHGLRLRRGAGGERRIVATGFVAAAFVHRTSRSGDPQLHTHVLVANSALGVDGTWSAPDARLLYFHARTAGFLYQAALRAQLTERLGVAFGPVVNGTAEVEGVPRPLLQVFSTRRAEIRRHLEEQGERSAKAAEVAALATRAPKEPGAGIDPAACLTLRDRWRQRAADLGLALPDLARLRAERAHCVGPPAAVDDLVTELTSPSGLTASESTFERRDVVRAVAERMANGASPVEVERIADAVLAAPEVTPLARVGRGGELLHTTAELLDVERALLDQATAARCAGRGLVGPHDLADALADFPVLAGEQRDMVARLTTSGAGVDVVVGKAGAGKTTALAAAVGAWTRAGYDVWGVALSARAAIGLGDGTGVPATTITRFVRDLDAGSAHLSDRSVVVVDEAGMVGTRSLAGLVGRCGVAGAKLVLVGDHRQLPEIEAGGAFAALVHRIGAARLTENRRQEQAWERLALDELRHGDPGHGLGTFIENDRAHAAPTVREAMAAMVARWATSAATGEKVAMLAVNRRDVDVLNAMARTELRSRGQLGADVATVDGLGLAVGDRVLCLRNDRALAIANGTLGVVDAVDERTGVTVTTAQGLRQLPWSYVEDGHLAHGYATTVHKSQGATVDRAFVLATASLTREAGYVAMSRARRGTELFVPSGAFEDGIDRDPAAEPARDAFDGVARRLRTSRAKQLAHADVNPWPRPSAMTTSVREEAIGADVRTIPIPADPRSRPEDRYLGAVLGRRPAFLDERAVYDDLAAAITDYRTHHGIDGDDALGPPPLAAASRLVFDDLARRISTYQRRLGREIALDHSDRGLGR